MYRDRRANHRFRKFFCLHYSSSPFLPVKKEGNGGAGECQIDPNRLTRYNKWLLRPDMVSAPESQTLNLPPRQGRAQKLREGYSWPRPPKTKTEKKSGASGRLQLARWSFSRKTSIRRKSMTKCWRCTRRPSRASRK